MTELQEEQPKSKLKPLVSRDFLLREPKLIQRVMTKFFGSLVKAWQLFQELEGRSNNIALGMRMLTMGNSAGFDDTIPHPPPPFWPHPLASAICVVTSSKCSVHFRRITAFLSACAALLPQTLPVELGAPCPLPPTPFAQLSLPDSLYDIPSALNLADFEGLRLPQLGGQTLFVPCSVFRTTPETHRKKQVVREECRDDLKNMTIGRKALQQQIEIRLPFVQST